MVEINEVITILALSMIPILCLMSYLWDKFVICVVNSYMSGYNTGFLEGQETTLARVKEKLESFTK